MTDNFCSYQPVNRLYLAASALVADLRGKLAAPVLAELSQALAEIDRVSAVAKSDFGKAAIGLAFDEFHNDDIGIDDLPFIAVGDIDDDGVTPCWVNAWLYVRNRAEQPTAPVLPSLDAVEIPSAEELEEMFSPDGCGEHPGYPQEDWRCAIEDRDTISGYWTWVRHQLIEEAS